MQYRHRRLQRSVTETRTLPSGRPSVSRSGSDMRRTAGRIDPDLTAIKAEFLFPHRDSAFHLFDHKTARLERLRSVRRRRGDPDARLASRNRAEAVPDRDLRVGPALRGVGHEPAELRLHHLLVRSEEHTSELQSHVNLVCRLLLEKK